MPDDPDAKKEEESQSSKDIQIPSIPKQPAAAVVGAAVGSVGGPIGAVVGGVAGAIAGKAAEKKRPIASPTKRAAQNVVKSSKRSRKHPVDDVRAKNPLSNRVKGARTPAAR
jgi:phage tail tape-measure protein